MDVVERARPMLGTVVRIKAACALPDADALRALGPAFDAAANIHRLMSFHDGESELSRLNRDAAQEAVTVAPQTLLVLQTALEVAEASGGAFDPTVGALAVTEGGLPAPPGGPAPDPAATWRDVELDIANRTVRFHRRLWLDFGGVAKGYAVDEACAALNRAGFLAGLVDAGGDLRAFGPEPETIFLNPGPDITGQRPCLHLSNSALASSGSFDRLGLDDTACAAHFDGRARARLPFTRFASVNAPRCILADALTKVLLILGSAGAPVLEHFGAAGLIYDMSSGWWTSAGLQ